MSDLYGRFLDDEKNLNIDELNTSKMNSRMVYILNMQNATSTRLIKYSTKTKGSKNNGMSKKNSWYRKAVKGKEVKEVWESHGAYFKSNGYSTTWYLGETPFYTWYSRANVDEEHPKLLAANEKFNEMLGR